jgi:hypothetical protein
MGVCTSRQDDNVETPEMRARQREIELQLRRDKKGLDREVKLLLLGMLFFSIFFFFPHFLFFSFSRKRFRVLLSLPIRFFGFRLSGVTTQRNKSRITLFHKICDERKNNPQEMNEKKKEKPKKKKKKKRKGTRRKKN